MRIIFLTFLLVLSNNLILFSQVSDYGSKTTIYNISSNEKKEYKLKVTLPKNYNENKAYKTLYYLDGWWLSELVLGSYAVLSVTENVEDIILVGISIDGNVLDWNIQRTYDFTPSKYEMPIEQKVGIGEDAITLDSITTGGGSIFINFLETKVLSFIDNRFSNIEKKRGFIGHSFGGLFGVYIMKNRPEIFTDFIIISPSLWWNNYELLNEESFHSFNQHRGPKKVHLSYGANESAWIVRSNTKMDGIINKLGKDQLDYQFVAYQKSNHNSVLPRAIYDGLKHLYSK